MYRLLLLLLPRELREDFASDMLQLYRDRLAEANGPLAQLRVRVASWRDLIWQAGLEHGQEFTRATTRGGGMDTWLQDLRYGLRTLTRRPGFAATAIGTLALGIGATVSIFSVVNSVLLSPLPYPDSERLVVVWAENTENGNRSRGVDHPDVRALQAAVPDLALAGFSATRPTLTGFGDPDVVFGTRVTDGMITLLGLSPRIGRDLTAADDDPGAARVVVVSHEFWVERLAADPDPLGRTLELSGESWEIVGVAPEGFDYPGGSQLWMPRRHVVDDCGHGCRIVNAVGRLDAGRSIEQVQERLTAAASAISEDFPDAHRDETFALESLLDYEVADVRAALWVLLGAVGIVLLIACANVANLFLVRASSRRGEIALRATLGAARGRIVRQLLTESLLVAVAAAAIGLGLANVGVTALARLAPPDLPRLDTFAVDGTAVLFAMGLALVVAAVFGVVPALAASSQAQDTRRSNRTTEDRRTERSRSMLLGAEVALSLTLLLGAGLLIRTLGEMRSVELGFDPAGVERFRVSLPGTSYDSLAIGIAFEQMEDELASIPGVAAAGWGFGVPMASGNITASFQWEDREPLAGPDQPDIAIRPVTSGLLDALGMELLSGRWITDDDRYGAPNVGVINRSAAERYFPDSDPIGQRISPSVSWSFATSHTVEIVGVIDDVIMRSPTERVTAGLYLSNKQFGANNGYFHIRLSPGVATVVPEARRRIAAMDGSLAVWDVTTLDDAVAAATTDTRFYATLLTVFSVVALLLATVGLYGVVAYNVSQRTREIGVRIALGAASDDVATMVARRGIRPALIGMVAGLGLSWLLARFLGTLLFSVTWQDPLTLLGGVTVLAIAFVAAMVLPARRAARISPSSALRAD